MNVVIVGAGAVGTWFGRVLEEIGCTVTFAPRELELVLPAKPDVVVVAVKAYDTQRALLTLRALLGESSSAAILTLQNGIGNEEEFANVFGADAVIAGALTVPIERTASGDSFAANRGGLALAPMGKQAYNWLLAALHATPVPVTVFTDYRALKWSKLSLNILANASCAILDQTPAEVLAHPGIFALEMEALREVAAVMEAARITRVDLPKYPVRALLTMAQAPASLTHFVLPRLIARARGGKLPSLLLDLRANKVKSEVAWLNGAVVAAARNLHLAAPVNAAFARLLDEITALPGRWSKFREQPEVLLAEVLLERQRWQLLPINS